jgi:diguanylate cyclase (GGDEF)-like protein
VASARPAATRHRPPREEGVCRCHVLCIPAVVIERGREDPPSAPAWFSPSRRPLDTPGMTRRAFPFAAAAVLAVATVVLPPGNPKHALLIAAVALTALVIVACVVVPWRRLPSWLQSAPPFTYFAVVAMLRDAEGGAVSGFSPLIMLPFFWVSLYGTRALLAAASAVTAAVLVVPIVLIGAPEYPSAEWRRAIIWMSIVPAVGFTIHALVERVERLARTDSLTGALNRRALDEELERALSRALRLDEPLSLALLDLDHFKRFNDTHGHVAGDEFLRSVVGTWRGLVREIDVVARFGGEEFCVCMPATTIDDAEILIDRLLCSVPDGETASAGIVEWDSNDDATTLVRRADEALYRAKQEGRNRSRRARTGGPVETARPAEARRAVTGEGQVRRRRRGGLRPNPGAADAPTPDAPASTGEHPRGA